MYNISLANIELPKIDVLAKSTAHLIEDKNSTLFTKDGFFYRTG